MVSQQLYIHSVFFDKYLYFVGMRYFSSFLIILFSVVLSLPAFGQAPPLPQLYSAAYGEKDNPAIIFLHGGPGYNSFSFEASTAQRLASEGFYVVVFDQRGCGRSAEPDGSLYNFDEATADLKSIYAQYGIKQATLVGHSWGGTLGIVFTERFPAMVSTLVLTGSPVDYQQTFKAIIANCKRVYTEKKVDEQLKYIAMLETMDTKTLEYANYCFMHAMGSGLYQAKKPAENTKNIYQKMMGSPDASYLTNMTIPPVAGFYEKEQYTTLNLYDRLGTICKKKLVYGIYGSEDGLFDTTQLDAIKSVLGADKLIIVDNASHNVFVEQQDIFVSKLKEYMKK